MLFRSAGKVVLAGPATDGSLGLVVFPHASEAEARELASEDPSVLAGVMAAEVKPFRMSLFGTGSGRDWLGFTQAIHVRADAASAWRMLSTCDGLERWFLARADAIGRTRHAAHQRQHQGFGVILHMDPIADIRPIAIDGQRAAFQGV